MRRFNPKDGSGNRYFKVRTYYLSKKVVLYTINVCNIIIFRQSDFLKQLAHYLDQNVLEMSQSIYRHFMLQIALKCADISK